MLTPAEVKPLLQHQDRHVRLAAARYFHDSWSRDPEVLPAVLEACRRHGDIRYPSALHFCRRLVLTPEGIDEALRYLLETKDPWAVAALSGAVKEAPLPALLRREEAIRASTLLSPEVAESLALRKKLADRPAEQLWDDLQELARKSQDKYVGEIDHNYADALVEALAPEPVPDTETLCRLLGDPEPEAGWLDVFLVDLAGERRCRAAIPALADKFRIDTDYLLEQSQKALAKIGTPDVVGPVRALFGTTGDPSLMLYTADLLGEVKHPEAEEAALALLETERDSGTRTDLCFGLCKLFSRRGLDVVLDEIEEGYERFLVCLEDEALAVADALGVELPQGKRWRPERAARETKAARTLAAMEAEDRSAMFQKATQGPAPPAPPRPALPPPKPAPFEKERRHVGRNDPCPCGSGKKFKNCCLRKS